MNSLPKKTLGGYLLSESGVLIVLISRLKSQVGTYMYLLGSGQIGHAMRISSGHSCLI